MNIRKIQTSLMTWMLLSVLYIQVNAQTAMTNIYGRQTTSLNGQWEAIIDQGLVGRMRGMPANRQPQQPHNFVEYSFEGGLKLNVPGDFNSQVPELKYYESSIWYKRDFELDKNPDKRYFIYFGAVNYIADVFVNGREVGSHEGGFTPFQFEITDLLRQGDNFLIVHVNNARREDGIPGLRFDWWNFGGITRDVFLVETPQTYIHDYTIQLSGNSFTEIGAYVHLDGSQAGQDVRITIPEANVDQIIRTDESGKGQVLINTDLELWSPQSPKLYDVVISTPHETIQERIGFRTIETRGSEILLNGEPVFLKGINIHEEIPMRKGRAFSEADAALLLREAQLLGCNFIRFGHISPFEKMVRMAEEMGMMMWEEIPTWQRITFDNPKTVETGERMIREMIARDKNRAGVIFWSVANETQNNDARNKALIGYVDLCRELDPTRLVTAAFNNMRYDASTETLTLTDPLADMLDVVSINKYFGWYDRWPVSPDQLKVEIANDRPLIYSEFGSESLYGNDGHPDVAHTWSELHHEKLHKDHILFFDNIPNLRGVAPWLLYDFRSPTRMHQYYQNGWNRKGLISDQGFHKRAWYIMHEYFQRK